MLYISAIDKIECISVAENIYIKSSYFPYSVINDEELNEWRKIFELCDNLLIKNDRLTQLSYKWNAPVIILEGDSIEDIINKLQYYHTGYYIVDKIYSSTVTTSSNPISKDRYNLFMYNLDDYLFKSYITPYLRVKAIDKILTEL